MTTVLKELTTDNPELITEKDSKSVVRATSLLLKRLLKDQVFTVR